MPARRDYTERVKVGFAGVNVCALEEGLKWYAKARSDILAFPSLSALGPVPATAIVAVLSPGISWDQNLIAADAVARGSKVNIPAYGPNVEKARRIAEDPQHALVQLGGHKVTSFFDNLLAPEVSRAVTIDRHVLRAIWPRYTLETLGKWLSRAGMYEALTRSFQRVADEFGLLPHQVQAALWVHVRG